MYNLIASAHSTFLLAADSFGGEEAVNEFWTQTGAGKALAAVLGVVGVLVLIGGGFKAFKSFADGKTGAGLKVLLGAAVLAGLLLAPGILTEIAGVAGSLFKTVVQSFGEIAS